jgi:hypothetical protein
MAQDMRRDAFVLQQGAGLPGRGEVFGQEIRDPIPAQWAASGVGEHGGCGATLAFSEPEPQGRGRFLPEGRTTLLAPFALATHVGSRTKHHDMRLQQLILHVCPVISSGLKRRKEINLPAESFFNSLFQLSINNFSHMIAVLQDMHAYQIF